MSQNFFKFLFLKYMQLAQRRPLVEPERHLELVQPTKPVLGIEPVVTNHFKAMNQALDNLGMLRNQGTAGDVINSVYPANDRKNASKVDATDDHHKFWADYLPAEPVFVDGDFIFEEKNTENGVLKLKMELLRKVESLPKGTPMVLEINNPKNLYKNTISGQDWQAFLEFAKEQGVYLHFNSVILQDEMEMPVDDETMRQKATELMLGRLPIQQAIKLGMQFTHHETATLGTGFANKLFHHNPAGRLPRLSQANVEDEQLSFPFHKMTSEIGDNSDLQKEWASELGKRLQQVKFIFGESMPVSLSQQSPAAEEFWRKFSAICVLVQKDFYTVFKTNRFNYATSTNHPATHVLNFLDLATADLKDPRVLAKVKLFLSSL